MQYQDNTATTPTSQDLVIHSYQMQNNPEYAANYNFQQATANQGLEDMSALFIPAGAAASKGLGRITQPKGLGEFAPGGSQLAQQQQLLRAGGQSQTADAFAVQDAVRMNAIRQGEINAHNAALRKGSAADTFAQNEALRNASIENGVDLAAAKGLGRVTTAKDFAMQEALRKQAIHEGTVAAKLKSQSLGDI